MHVVITGAAGALGTAAVDAFLRRGDSVTGVVRSNAIALPAGARMVCAENLARPQDAQKAMAEAAAQSDKIDALINLAGAFEWKPVESTTAADWIRLHEANVGTALAAIQAALPHMSAGGAIVCVGAASAQPAGEGMAAYASAKSGVARLTESLAQELRPRRIRVNAIAPGVIDTPSNRRAMPGIDPALWTSTAALADTLLFLASPASRAVNGQVLTTTNAA
jgi:NAD(P)-dependent dehydrogenase (short-subunit alcohol dehydrogenase family)